MVHALNRQEAESHSHWRYTRLDSVCGMWTAILKLFSPTMSTLQRN